MEIAYIDSSSHLRNSSIGISDMGNAIPFTEVKSSKRIQEKVLCVPEIEMNLQNDRI
jgi:hypothetical protein